mmetsp:Transcript_61784/g.177201  ORF Transcript_61784/g.177201 Transcript_61784/m.177201 type:complete len:80 (+) Transcript_61784:178-417(+)
MSTSGRLTYSPDPDTAGCAPDAGGSIGERPGPTASATGESSSSSGWAVILKRVEGPPCGVARPPKPVPLSGVEAALPPI